MRWPRLPLHGFRPRLLDTLKGYDARRFAADAGAGITVAIVALPLAMAFAIASGVKPEQGLVTAIVAGLIISLLGGSNVQIGGPAGAFIVVVYGIVQHHGFANLLIATVLAGMLLFAMGWLRLGALVRYIPVSIVIGFTNGIAVLIALSQVRDLLGLRIEHLPADFFSQLAAYGAAVHTFDWHALVLGLACLGVLFLWPRLFRPGSLLPASVLEHRTLRGAARMPAPVVALVLLSGAAAWLQWPVETIGTRFGGIPRALPDMAWPSLSWASAQQLLIPTLTIALLGAIESLLCARVADNLTDLPKHDPNQELMAQGVANMVTPFFGGIPATGTIARTVTNVRAGARSPVAGVVHALALLLIVLALAPLAVHVPLAVLAGILLFVAWNMGEWHEFKRLRRFAPGYRVILLGTFGLTVVFDLTVAVQAGLVAACIFFVWRMGTMFDVRPLTFSSLPPNVQAFELYGALFFGAVGKMEALPARVAAGTHAVVLDLHRLLWIDSSGIDALLQLYRALQRRGVALVLADVNPQPLGLLHQSGFDGVIGQAHIVPTMGQALRDLR